MQQNETGQVDQQPQLSVLEQHLNMASKQYGASFIFGSYAIPSETKVNQDKPNKDPMVDQ